MYDVGTDARAPFDGDANCECRGCGAWYRTRLVYRDNPSGLWGFAAKTPCFCGSTELNTIEMFGAAVADDAPIDGWMS